MRPELERLITLAKKGDLIWLPNALVDGAGAEVPPLAKVRSPRMSARWTPLMALNFGWTTRTR